ncbi:IS1380 family transposase [Streptomyces scopuliridis]|uniref:IS1380 family transposase n=1 Tax=Streptomyces scopuliridis TaxID=452529 RepID=A0ACD4ZBK2_9ACTN|nr:IS1380 family transposase [Streptomyces scopuliridis]WSB95618.1 IS1380 family transposase [Streptomyces scopuliridis]WSC10673.1 IS1380 family transposase [Streptomyces scopuliridis]
MSKRIGLYPRVRVVGGGSGAVSKAGAVLLVQTVRKVGLDTAISAALAPWRKPRTVHDPGKVLLDVALATALGGDCLADVAMLRAEPDMFGPVASDPTVSRLIDALAAAGPKALTAIRTARAEVRSRVWKLAGADSPAAGGSVIVDIDGVLVLAHSEKQDATATWKKTFGHHPLVAFVDHGPAGSGEPVAALLRPGNAGSNTAAEHIETAQLALAQLPKHLRRGRQTLIRTDSAGGTHTFLDWLSRPGRWLSYSVGMPITDTVHQAVLKIPKKAWAPAYDASGTERPGAWVAEITDMPDLNTWPKGMRLVVRKERPHPGAQLRFTDLDGLRLTCFATNTKGGQLAGLELRHRRRARCEDRIRGARDTGLRNLPLQDTAQNQIWLEIAQLALDLLAWMPILALTGRTRRWEPKKLRLRLFSAAAQLVTTGRRHWLRFTARWPWTDIITHAIDRLHTLPNPI